MPELARQLRRAATEPVAAHDALIRMIRAWERGDHRPSERYELLYRKLGLIPPTDIDPPDAQAARTASLEDDDPVRRRTFIELTGISAATALLAIPSGTRPPLDTEPLALALTAQMTGIAPEPAQEPPNIAALTLSVTRARAHYQACRYAELITRLPRLLAQLDAACNFLDGDDKLRAYTLAADAYHLTAGILLKTGDHSLAHLATDRSMTAALASQDPLTVGASARIVTHTLASSGHLPAAIATAQNHSQRVDRQTGTHTPESLSVYGSVLLRGALAAAQHDDRTTAHEMLTEASGTARRLGTDANLRGTALGPVNAQLHQVNIAVTLGDVNIAVTLGDAGTAIDLARQIDPAAITVTERLPACSSTLPRHSSSGAVQTGLHHVSRRRADRPAGTHRPGPGPRPGPQPRRPGPARHPPRRCAPRRPDRRLRMTPNGRVLTAVVCGAGPAVATGTLVKLACDRGWMVQVVATPAALEFFDEHAIADLTGSLVRSQYAKPGAPRSQVPDAIVVAPANYNTINKWAQDISDTYALGVLAEATGLGVPIVVLPFVNTALASRAPFRRSVDSLRAEGVKILLGPGGFQPHPPRTGGNLIDTYPWHLGLDEAQRMIDPALQKP